MSEHDVHIRRIFRASRQEVFRAWTESTRLARWMAPARWRHWADIDAQIGAPFSLRMESPKGDMIEAVGTYGHILLPRPLA